MKRICFMLCMLLTMGALICTAAAEERIDITAGESENGGMEPAPVTVTLSSGSWVVGETVETGTYNCTAISGSGTLTISDAEGIVLVNKVLHTDVEYLDHTYSGYVARWGDVIQVEEGLQVTLISQARQGFLMDPPLSYTVSLTEGRYTVGSDILPGRYNCHAVEAGGNLVIKNVDGTLKVNERLYWNRIGKNEVYRNYMAELGDTVQITGTLLLELRPSL